MRPQLFHFLTILSIFILLFLYTKTVGPIPFQVSSVTTQKSDTFQVSGEGISTIKPDIAVVSAGITAQAPTIKGAQDQINSVINKVSSSVKNLGIDSKDIQTTNYNIHPTYDYSGSIQRITGYQASTNLKIKVRDIDKVNSVLDTATTNGANQIGGVSFDVDDKTKAENEARAKAVEEAKKKAQQAASIAGFNLGKIINYSENFNSSPIIPLGRGAMELSSKDTTTQIEPGSSEIKVTVTLSYEIR